MARKKSIKQHKLLKDPIYGEVLVTKLINRVMKDGKKTIARKQVYQALEMIKKKKKEDPLIVFNQALSNIRPQVEVRTRRVGGAAYQVPRSVKRKRQDDLAVRWLVLEARKRPNKQYHTFAEKLFAEITDAAQKEGGAVDKKQQMEKIADANKAFAHLRW